MFVLKAIYSQNQELCANTKREKATWIVVLAVTLGYPWAGVETKTFR